MITFSVICIIIGANIIAALFLRFLVLAFLEGYWWVSAILIAAVLMLVGTFGLIYTHEQSNVTPPACEKADQ